ncbi:MAG: hypothetical protein IJQ37_03455 [Clostridia bacterium]|nr:hypothetical protein [Clostridia bacterium]
MSKSKKSYLVYLWALLPLALAGLYLLMLAINADLGAFLQPITKLSVVGVLLCLLSVFITGFAGFRFSRNGKSYLKSAIIYCSVPLLCALAFTVMLIIGQSESGAALTTLFIGNGMMLAATDYIMLIIGKTSTAIEAYASLALTVICFTVGYAFGTTKKKK